MGLAGMKRGPKGPFFDARTGFGIILESTLQPIEFIAGWHALGECKVFGFSIGYKAGVLSSSPYVHA
jgi:hypothetical protein